MLAWMKPYSPHGQMLHTNLLSTKLPREELEVALGGDCNAWPDPY